MKHPVKHALLLYFRSCETCIGTGFARLKNSNSCSTGKIRRCCDDKTIAYAPAKGYNILNKPGMARSRMSTSTQVSYLHFQSFSVFFCFYNKNKRRITYINLFDSTLILLSLVLYLYLFCFSFVGLFVGGFKCAGLRA